MNLIDELSQEIYSTSKYFLNLWCSGLAYIIYIQYANSYGFIENTNERIEDIPLALLTGTILFLSAPFIFLLSEVIKRLESPTACFFKDGGLNNCHSFDGFNKDGMVKCKSKYRGKRER